MVFLELLRKACPSAGQGYVAVSDQHRWGLVEDKEDLDAAGLDGSLLWLMEKRRDKGQDETPEAKL